jgi:hypothetical protein
MINKLKDMINRLKGIINSWRIIDDNRYPGYHPDYHHPKISSTRILRSYIISLFKRDIQGVIQGIKGKRLQGSLLLSSRALLSSINKGDPQSIVQEFKGKRIKGKGFKSKRL